MAVAAVSVCTSGAGGMRTALSLSLQIGRSLRAVANGLPHGHVFWERGKQTTPCFWVRARLFPHDTTQTASGSLLLADEI